MTMPVHHGAGAAVATGACATGGTAVLLDPYDPEEALELIDRHKVQLWVGVPTMLLRIQALPEDVVERYDLSSIQALTVGAAPVPQSLKQWIVEHFGPVLWEGYGTSESGMVSYMPPDHQLTKPGSSGVPYDGVEIAIVDDEWNRLPVGETGEIAVNTPVVLRGYLGREPLGDDVVRDGFYRTGDVGHVDEDGFLFITDRIKDMIVAGGVNIYPAEIEKALVGSPCCRRRRGHRHPRGGLRRTGPRVHRHPCGPRGDGSRAARVPRWTPRLVQEASPVRVHRAAPGQPHRQGAQDRAPRSLLEGATNLRAAMSEINLLDLTGRTALVTGAGQGVGARHGTLPRRPTEPTWW